MPNSPYLKPGRLPDVIACITALGTYKFYKLNAAGWADRISGQQRPPEHWTSVFDEHPEFFRRAVVEQDKFSLVWRRQFPKRYDVDTSAEVVSVEGKTPDRLSRRPLAPTEITALIEVAIGLHKSALEHTESRRWWIPLFAALLSFVGALVGGLVSSGVANPPSNAGVASSQTTTP